MATAKKLPSGSYRVRVFIGMIDGKKTYKSFTASTKKEAEYQASCYLVNRQRISSPMNLTVGEAIDRYIASKDVILSPSTIVGYKRCRKLYLQSIIDVSLKDLTKEAVQKAVNEDAKTRTPKTIRNAHGLLSATLAEYYPDFTLRTRLPQKVKLSLSTPDDKAIRELLNDARGTVMEIVILLGACGGLRRSEMCALTRDDIDEESGRVRINKAVVEKMDEKTGKPTAWAVKGTKTHSGTRDIFLPLSIVQRVLALAPPEGNIITFNPNSITAKFVHLRKKHGFSFRLHDLRHYNASVMLAMGVPDKYAMKRMGHATPNMLKTVYQHTMDEKEAEISAQVNEYFDDFT